MTTFERIKKISRDKGWSLQNVATKAGLGTNSIYKWKEQTPKLDKLKQVADVLDVSVDYLLGEEDNPKAPQAVDLNDDSNYYTFDGKPVSKEDMELFKRLMRGK